MESVNVLMSAVDEYEGLLNEARKAEDPTKELKTARFFIDYLRDTFKEQSKRNTPNEPKKSAPSNSSHWINLANLSVGQIGPALEAMKRELQLTKAHGVPEEDLEKAEWVKARKAVCPNFGSLDIEHLKELVLFILTPQWLEGMLKIAKRKEIEEWQRAMKESKQYAHADPRLEVAWLDGGNRPVYKNYPGSPYTNLHDVVLTRFGSDGVHGIVAHLFKDGTWISNKPEDLPPREKE